MDLNQQLVAVSNNGRLCGVPEHNVGTWVQWPLTHVMAEKKNKALIKHGFL